MSVPKWPDFSLTRGKPTSLGWLWIARTDTGRPKTPIFALSVEASDAWSNEEVRQVARIELDRRYEAAHPSGCPQTRRTPM